MLRPRSERRHTLRRQLGKAQRHVVVERQIASRARLQKRVDGGEVRGLAAPVPDEASLRHRRRCRRACRVCRRGAPALGLRSHSRELRLRAKAFARRGQALQHARELQAIGRDPDPHPGREHRQGCSLPRVNCK